MYKIVEAAQERFKQKPSCELSVSLECLGVQNKMLQFAMFKNTPQNEQEEQLKYTTQKIQQYKQLIRQIYRVSKLYKRKSKKVRNSLIQAPVNNSKKKKKQIKVEQKDDDDEDDNNQDYIPKLQNTILIKSQNYNQSQNYDDIKKQQFQFQNQNGNYPEKFNYQSQNKQIKSKNKKNGHFNNKIQVQQGQGIQQLLRTAGILHDDIKPKQNRQKNSRKYSSSQYSINSVNMANPLLSSPNLSSQPPPMNFITTNSSGQYSPLHSFTSQQVQNFLGFPMINNGNQNGYANFTLSQKSSFKSYSEIDPSEIENPFFDYQSSNNGRVMFPMNFNLPATNQYQSQFYNNGSMNSIQGTNQMNNVNNMNVLNGNLNNSYNGFGYPNVYYSQEEKQKKNNTDNSQK